MGKDSRAKAHALPAVFSFEAAFEPNSYCDEAVKAALTSNRPDSHALILSYEGYNGYTDIRHIFHLFGPRAIANLENLGGKGPWEVGNARSRPTGVIGLQYSTE